MDTQLGMGAALEKAKEALHRYIDEYRIGPAQADFVELEHESAAMFMPAKERFGRLVMLGAQLPPDESDQRSDTGYIRPVNRRYRTKFVDWSRDDTLLRNAEDFEVQEALVNLMLHARLNPKFRVTEWTGDW